ncbi:MAG: tRNA glutamyl-Q(34) synthetase GluQRS [Gemmatimonadetes bacterium]|nr:tRNA glutamyl-Q(34) synthetase GluQRS [Gemmatimonadota bacterium]
MKIDLNGLPAKPVTRFAPSPTGRLHLGHVANAVWTWGIAAARGGRVILRIEDHDRGRSRKQFEASVVEDLAWLGLEAEPRSISSLLTETTSEFRQSDNEARYAAALDRLGAASSLYHCGCSRRTIAEAAGPAASGAERRYPGTCRTRNLPAGPGRGTRVVLPDETVSFEDLRHGPVTQYPARQCGDLLVRDGVGNWTYQYCVVVDDQAHGVDLVVRGDDLLASTGRQIMLGTMLGRRQPPRFLHHPLIMAPTGQKLSKRDGAPGLDDLRRAGLSPGEVLGMAAKATGLLDRDRPLAPDRLGELFG